MNFNAFRLKAGQTSIFGAKFDTCIPKVKSERWGLAFLWFSAIIKYERLPGFFKQGERKIAVFDHLGG